MFATRVFPGGAVKLLLVFGAALGWPAALIVPATALVAAVPSRLRARSEEAQDEEAPSFALPLPMTIGAGLTLAVQALLAA
jgi:Flp pilus assembly protein protease CpaA